MLALVATTNPLITTCLTPDGYEARADGLLVAVRPDRAAAEQAAADYLRTGCFPLTESDCASQSMLARIVAAA